MIALVDLSRGGNVPEVRLDTFRNGPPQQKKRAVRSSFMDVRSALKEQYHAGLAMLGQCVDLCPDDMWTLGEHPRTFYRIVFHCAFFTHLYLGQDLASFKPWPGRRPEWHPGLWEDPAYVEPYELPEGAEVYSPGDLRAYINYVDGLVDEVVDGLDLDTDDSGFSWYETISKMSHELMNLRHIQGHVGQLSELLMARGIDIYWISHGSVP